MWSPVKLYRARRASEFRVKTGLAGCLSGAVLVFLLLLLIVSDVHAWGLEPGYVPMRRDLPNGIDMLESGLYWMQDLSGVDDPRDPASVVSLMQDRMARYFDLSYMSYLVAGARYTRMDVLQRSHFQNRVRDALFELLARQMGFYNNRLPTVVPLMPVPSGSRGWAVGGVLAYPNTPAVYLRFHFYLSSRGWRVFDITSNDYSLLAELRRRFQPS